MGAHARPRPAVAAGTAARQAGATAMIDVSDGLLADLAHWQPVRCRVRAERVPVAPGATEQEALGGGEDFVLVFTLAAGRGRGRRPGPVRSRRAAGRF